MYIISVQHSPMQSLSLNLIPRDAIGWDEAIGTCVIVNSEVSEPGDRGKVWSNTYFQVHEVEVTDTFWHMDRNFSLDVTNIAMRMQVASCIIEVKVWDG